MLETVNSGNLEFNYENAKKKADIYSQSCGVECSIIDSHGDTVYKSCGDSPCNFCNEVRQTLKGKVDCSKAHLYGSYQAERFGGKYIYFCPMGLVHWASPIISDGSLKGAFLGGPVTMVDPDEFMLGDFIRKNEIDETYIIELEKHLHEIPVISPVRVNALADLLFICASSVSEEQLHKYVEEQRYLEQQADVSEYVHHLKSMDLDEGEIRVYPLEKEKELLTYISMGDKSNSQRVLNEILGHIFFSTGSDFKVIKARVLELVVLLSRAALEGGADIELVFGLNYGYINEINDFHTIEELTFWLSKIMGRFTDCVFNLAEIKHADIIYKAIDFIKRNYMKKITLEDVASHVYLSPSYFSKIFKEEMSTSFSSYLNGVRIKMSKGLLLDNSIPLVEVSTLVGYENQSYFTKMFKKVVGLSPGKYRERRGQVRNKFDINKSKQEV
jgi:two-component system response regulator YesN